MSAPSLSTLDTTTRRERAAQALRTAVTSGEFKPGEHLGEVDLAQRLGVSRGTVREALRPLQQEGLIVADARNRLRVNQLEPAEVVGLYQVRSALESLAVRTIMDSGDPANAVLRLGEAAALLADESLSFVDRVQADLAFHLLLCELSGNAMLVESWKHLEGRIRVAIMSHDADQLPAIMSRERHAMIADGIGAGDVPAAVATVEEHMAVAAQVYAAATTA